MRHARMAIDVRLLDALHDHAYHLHSKPAIVDNAGSATYAELDEAINKVAHLLAAKGVHSGDVVALAIEPTAPGIVLLLGVMELGAIAAPVNTRLAQPEIVTYLGRISPSMLLVGPCLRRCS